MLISTVTVAFHRRPDGTYAADIDAPFYRRSTVEAATFDDLIDLIQVTPEWVAFNPDGDPVDVETTGGVL